MTNVEFVEKILGVKLSATITDPQDKCTGLRCPEYMNIATPCEEVCPHCFFWHKEVDWVRVGAILISIPELSKAFLNSIYGIKYIDTDSILWQEIPLFMRDMSIEQLYEIIDDAEANGFEFKVRCGRLMWREK